MDSNMFALLGALQESGAMVEGAEEGKIEVELLTSLAQMVRTACASSGKEPREFFENSLSMARSMMTTLLTNPMMKDLLSSHLEEAGAEVPENIETVVTHMNLTPEHLMGNLVKSARMGLSDSDLTEEQFEQLSWLIQTLEVTQLN